MVMPNIIIGIPIMAPMMVRLSIIPKVVKINPSNTTISLPVNFNKLSTIFKANVIGKNNNFI